jgi:hypothetical protein
MYGTGVLCMLGSSAAEQNLKQGPQKHSSESCIDIYGPEGKVFFLFISAGEHVTATYMSSVLM